VNCIYLSQKGKKKKNDWVMDVCMEYLCHSASHVNLHYLMQDFRTRQEPAVDKLKEPIFDEITSALASRYGLNFTRQDTSSLWFLCKQVMILPFLSVIL
jgi:hypothetical protein